VPGLARGPLCEQRDGEAFAEADPDAAPPREPAKSVLAEPHATETVEFAVVRRLAARSAQPGGSPVLGKRDRRPQRLE